MAGAVEWTNLSIAGAFVVGAVLATVAYLRLTRHMLGMFTRRRRDDDDPPRDP